jgi:hypothetical protein
MVCYQAVENNIIYEEGIFIIDDLPELEEVDLPELIHGGDEGATTTGEDVGEDVKLVINPAAEEEEEDNEDEDSRPTFHINWLNLFINHANNHRDSWLRQF